MALPLYLVGLSHKTAPLEVREPPVLDPRQGPTDGRSDLRRGGDESNR